MGLSHEDRILIKNLYYCKGYGAVRLINEFPTKHWKKSTVNDFIKHLKQTGLIDRKAGSGRPKTARTAANIDAVNDLVLSQEDKPQTHRTVRQIARETRIPRSSVARIIHTDLHLKCVKKRRAQELTDANCNTRMNRAKKLLSKFPESLVPFIFFTDEKVFTVAPPVNLQNDRVYAPRDKKKRDIAADRLLRTRPTFSKSVMVSVAVSKLGCTELFFVEPGVKVNGAYYRDVLLSQQMLPSIRQLAGDLFVFQQDSAPAHRARDTIEYLRQATPDFISPDFWPPNSPDLNPVDYKLWGCLQDRVYQKRIHDVNELKQRLVEVWSNFGQTIVDGAIDEWRKRLRACVRAKGHHFEHLL
jgi:hypothetical protein